MIIIDDHDANVSDDRNTVDVTVTTSSGEKLSLKALETEPEGRADLDNHAGVFMALLKIGDRTGRDQIKVAPGDEVTVSYLDKENTDPGVPVERTYSIADASEEPVQALVYRTSVKQVEDLSQQAQARKNRIKARQGWAPVIQKDLVVARHPKYRPQGAPEAAPQKPGEDPVVAINAPLLFELKCPKNALNSASVMVVTAVAESERKAALREGKPPSSLKVPLEIVPIDELAAEKGYTIQLQSATRRDAAQMLQDGVFAGIVRFEPGKRGDPVNDLVSREDGLALPARRTADPAGLSDRVATLRVAGADVVHLRYEDPRTKQAAEWSVRLLSDGRMELMDPTFTAQNDTIHLGGKFSLRVVDPDRDSTDARDTVAVRAKATSGDGLLLTLTKTLPHSGVFETEFPARAARREGTGRQAARSPPKGNKLYVTFGDNVTFTYEETRSACRRPGP